MANYKLIDLIESSKRVSETNLNDVFKQILREEREKINSMGIKEHFMKEMELNFDTNSDLDSGTDEENSDGEYTCGPSDFEGDEERDFDEEEFDPDEDDEDEFGDDEERMDSPDLSDLKVESKELYGKMKQPGYDFTKHPSDKKGKDKKKKANESAIGILSSQVKKMGGRSQSAKSFKMRRNDFVISETFNGSNTYILGKIQSIGKKGAKVRFNESIDFVKFSSMAPAVKSGNNKIRKEAEKLSAGNSRKTIWVSN